jgi:hypothetical protein
LETPSAWFPWGPTGGTSWGALSLRKLLAAAVKSFHKIASTFSVCLLGFGSLARRRIEVKGESMTLVVRRWGQ